MAAKESNELSAEQKALYDRQIDALGLDTMGKLIQQRVLIVGCRGLGVEIAKNVILAGPKSVTVADSSLVELTDLCAQFYLVEDDIGRNRAEASLKHLKELNPYVDVSAHTGLISRSFVTQFTTVVMTLSTPDEKRKVNEFCRTQNPPIKFITSEIHGLFGYLFNDYGPLPHIVGDIDGERERVGYVNNITATNPCVITMLEDFAYAFETGDYVTLSEVQGMTEINGLPAAKVTVKDRWNIELDLDASSFSEYKMGGIITQVKQPKEVKMRSLVDVMADPGEFMLTDFGKFDRPGKLHVAFGGLHGFQDAHQGALPEFNNAEHEEEVVACAREFAANLKDKNVEVDVELTKTLAKHARSELSPMASIFGGMVAQEVIKCTGKHMPFEQLLYMDALECLPKERPTDTEYSVTDRYSGQVCVFGKEFQKKLQKLNYFVVGAGALGCEFLKGMAMMGVATGAGGKITVTDMDHIEVSNLNRQFLFRNWHVGKPKSTCAVESVKQMNKKFNVEAKTTRVGPDTESVFNDKFWNSLDGVCNALDNVDARLYVDGRCVEFHKPLLESGTLGTKANVQVVVPNVTESYGSSRDPPEKDTPTCTLHNFPYLIEHCIQLAREGFETLFCKGVMDAQQFLEVGEKHIDALKNAHEKRVTLEAIEELLADKKAGTFEACVRWARLQFDRQFNHRIQQILLALPADKKDANGIPFWSGTKRIPSPLVFDADDETHLDFVFTGANLRAENLGIPTNTSLEEVRSMAAAVSLPEFKPKQIKIQESEKDAAPTQDMEDDDEVIARIMKEAPRDILAAELKMQDFEKDDDTNHHIDYIAAASNLRARCYTIPEAPRRKIKSVAGRIIPALATTTAMTTGFVLLELYKLVRGDAVIEDFRNTFVNLAIPFVTQSEPVPPKAHKSPGPEGETYFPEGYTLWDRFLVDEGDITLQRLMDWFEEKHNLSVSIVSLGESLMYATFMPAHKDRPKEKITTLYENFTGEKIPPHISRLQLVVGCEKDGDDVDVPVTYVKFR